MSEQRRQPGLPASDSSLAGARDRMVDVHVARRGVRDPRVLDAMRDVPREAFVEPGFEEFAYADSPLPIGEGLPETEFTLRPSPERLLTVRMNSVRVDVDGEAATLSIIIDDTERRAAEDLVRRSETLLDARFLELTARVRSGIESLWVD